MLGVRQILEATYHIFPCILAKEKAGKMKGSDDIEKSNHANDEQNMVDAKAFLAKAIHNATHSKNK